MNHYYGVTRSTDHLAHYGVKGMKWGVRRAILTGNDKALSRYYRKAAKKLAKLQDIGVNEKKYAKKAAAYGAAAIGTGTIAVGGTKKAGSIVRGVGRAGGNIASGAGLLTIQAATAMKKAKGFRGAGKVNAVGKVLSSAGQGMYKAGNAVTYSTAQADRAMRRWAHNETKFDNPFSVVTKEVKETVPSKKLLFWEISKEHDITKHVPVLDSKTRKPIHNKFTNDDLVKIGSGLAAVGLAAKSAQNAYRAANAKKYREKAHNFKQEMDEAFAGTRYEGQYLVPSRRKRKRR